MRCRRIVDVVLVTAGVVVLAAEVGFRMADLRIQTVAIASPTRSERNGSSGAAMAPQAARSVGEAPWSSRRATRRHPLMTRDSRVFALARGSHGGDGSTARRRRTADRTAERLVRSRALQDRAGELIAAAQLATPCTYPCGDCHRWCATYGPARPGRVGRAA